MSRNAIRVLRQLALVGAAAALLVPAAAHGEGVGLTITATAGTQFSGEVLRDACSLSTEPTPQIEWGDGGKSPGTVTTSPKGISGTHTYAKAGVYHGSVSYSDDCKANQTTPFTAEVAAAPTGTTSTGSSPPPAPPAPPNAGFTTSTPSIGRGLPLTLTASGSQPPGTTVESFSWTIDGVHVATCAGATPQLTTSFDTPGAQTIALTARGVTGLQSTSQQTVTVGGSPVATLPHARVLQLPQVYTCAGGAGATQVAPSVPGGPPAGCSQQVFAGIVEAVGCFTTYQDQATLATITTGPVTVEELFPANPQQAGFQGAGGLSAQLVDDIIFENFPPSNVVKYCAAQTPERLKKLQEGGACPRADYEEPDEPTHEFTGPGGLPGSGTSGNCFGQVQKEHGDCDGEAALSTGAGAGARSLRWPAATPAVAHVPKSTPYTFITPSCSSTPGPPGSVTIGQSGSLKQVTSTAPLCLELDVSTQPVRINGIDYDPAPGQEILIAPQFDLVLSGEAATSLDGLELHPSQFINYELPSASQGGGGASAAAARAKRTVSAAAPRQARAAGGRAHRGPRAVIAEASEEQQEGGGACEGPQQSSSASQGADQDFPALDVENLQSELKNPANAANPALKGILSELSSVGGFPSVGALHVSFNDDTASITFEVELPAPFSSSGKPVTAKIYATVSPTQPFHVICGYLGNTSGGADIDLGPLQLNGFGICYRATYSTDPAIDPCKEITGIEDSGFPNETWTASGVLDIAGEVKVAFRPGSDTIPGCAQDIPLGFAFSAGKISQAGAALDFSGAGGAPIIPGLVTVNGLAVGFSSQAHWDIFGGCLNLQVAEVLGITGNVFAVSTDGTKYEFNGEELGPGVLQKFGNPPSYPYTEHLAIGASGVVSLSLPDLPSFQVGDAYGLYVDDPAAVFFGAKFDFSVPSGNTFENPPNNGLAIEGGLNGAIGLTGGTPFDIEGFVKVFAQVGAGGELETEALNGTVEAIVSHAPNPQGGNALGGIGACGSMSVFGDQEGASVAYHWGDSILHILEHDIDIGSFACEDTWFNSQNLTVNVQAADARAHAAQHALTVRVPATANAVNLHVESSSGAPDVTVTGPGGASASTAGLPLGRMVSTPSFLLARVPALNETIVVPLGHAAGGYRITPNPGSPAITAVEQLDGVKPAIRARVSGGGTHRRLQYSIEREPGELVRFMEVSGQLDRQIGVASGGRGSIAFTATPGSGRREVEAEVLVDGAPQRRLDVASYEPPARAALRAVGHIRVKRHGGQVTVTFAAVPGAKSYSVYLALDDGARLASITGKRSVTLGPVFLEVAGRLSVRALGDGVNTTDGPSRTVSVAAAISTVKHLVRAKPKPRHRRR
jgi:hypothetical protein